jgi:hypothetical protein
VREQSHLGRYAEKTKTLLEHRCLGWRAAR